MSPLSGAGRSAGGRCRAARESRRGVPARGERHGCGWRASSLAPPSSPGACGPCARAPRPGACGACWAARIAGGGAPRRGYRPVVLCGRIASMRLQMSRPLGSQFDSRLAGAVGQIVSSRRSPVPASPFLRCHGRGRVKRAPALIGRSTVQRSLLAYHICAQFLQRIRPNWPECLGAVHMTHDKTCANTDGGIMVACDIVCW
jgi:hypothetical protein